MSAPAGWQKGSFRGAAFRTEEQEVTGGRRGVAHEFPQAEKPVWEDLGRSARRYRIDCHITGTDYPAGADALADALDQPGAGTLIHPWLGAMQVAVPQDGWSRRDSTVDGGIAWFSIEFIETGLPAPQTASTDTQAQATAAADTTIAAAPAQFASGYTLDGITGFVEQAAGDVVQAAALAVRVEAALAGGVGSTLSLLDSQLGLLGSAGALLRAPLDLGLSIVGLVQTLSAITGPGGSADLPRRASSFRTLMDWGSDLDPVIGGTPARAVQTANQAAIVQLVNLAASAELVRCHAATDFASSDDAVAARDDPSLAEHLAQVVLTLQPSSRTNVNHQIVGVGFVGALLVFAAFEVDNGGINLPELNLGRRRCHVALTDGPVPPIPARGHATDRRRERPV